MGVGALRKLMLALGGESKGLDPKKCIEKSDMVKLLMTSGCIQILPEIEDEVEVEKLSLDVLNQMSITDLQRMMRKLDIVIPFHCIERSELVQLLLKSDRISLVPTMMDAPPSTTNVNHHHNHHHHDTDTQHEERYQENNHINRSAEEINEQAGQDDYVRGGGGGGTDRDASIRNLFGRPTEESTSEKQDDTEQEQEGRKGEVMGEQLEEVSMIDDVEANNDGGVKVTEEEIIRNETLPVMASSSSQQETEPELKMEEAPLTWACSMCTLLNEPVAVKCEVCDSPKPGSS